MATRTPSRSRTVSPNKSMNRDITVDTIGGRNVADITNPFLAKPSGSIANQNQPPTAPSSPFKRPTSSLSNIGSSTSTIGSLSGMRQSIVGMDGWEGDMIGGSGANGLSSSQRGGFNNSRNLDRFIPSRPGSSASNDRPSLHGTSSGEYETSFSNIGNTSTASSTGANSGQPHTRILSFAAAPPPPSSLNPHASSHLDLSASFLPTSGTRTSGSSAAGRAAAAPPTQKRRIPTIPERVLDAPGYADDYYLNLVSWSCTNKVGIALGQTAYVWDADTGDVAGLGDEEPQNEGDVGDPICSLAWATDGAYLAIGLTSGDVELWDVDRRAKVRVMRGHQARVSSLSWTGSVLSTGCKDGSIHHHDVRVQKHLTHHLRAHTQEVCGLTWRSDGQLLASGANDNMVAVWDHRVMKESVVRESASTGESAPVVTPKWTKTNHTAAVKALAWCPWQSSLLATGGGTGDHTIHFWNSTTGARLSSLQTSSQITSLQWSPHTKEILATHGYPNCAISLWAYPSGQKVAENFNAHDRRILTSALSPDGCTVVTGAGDENLKFWKIWEPKRSKTDGRDADLLVKGKSGVSLWR